MRVERKVFLLAAIVMMAAEAFAFQPIPKESGKALGVTRGKPFSAGVVFVNGKYVAPPYTVERWGTGIRINQIPVTGQVVDWNEFLKTQEGVKMQTKAAAEPEAAKAAMETAASSAEESVSSLDELFDDDADAKPAKSRIPRASTPRPAAASRSGVSYALEGEFKANDASRALLGRVNAVRTEIDRVLRSGGFICFGNRYSRVTGDKRTLVQVLRALPELLQNSEDIAAFRAGVRSANLVYLNELLCEELFSNRVDYRRLKLRREQILSAEKWNRLVQDAADPVF